VNIRLAILADKDDVERLAQVLTPAAESKHRSTEGLSLLLSSNEHRVWVADSEEAVVGWLHAYLAVRIGVVPNTTGMQHKPTHPGEMLREDFLPDYGLTVKGLLNLWVSPANQLTNYCVNVVLSVLKWRSGLPVCLVTRRNSG